MSMPVWEEFVDLEDYNTFRVKSTARYLVRIQSPDIGQLVRSARFQNHRHFILGSGSNILLAHRTYDGIVLKNEIPGIDIVSQHGIYTTLKVGGGVIWDSLVTHCIKNRLGGIENLSMIPGTVGAAPIQNIGAYGVEVGDVIESVQVVDTRTGKARSVPKAECDFGYRDSAFKHELRGCLITSVTIKLTNANHYRPTLTFDSIKKILEVQGSLEPTIQSVSDAVRFIRRQKLPALNEIGNAGSFFVNVVVDASMYQGMNNLHPYLPSFPALNGSKIIPAAWLIEKCGWKGVQLGRVGVYAHNALVLVNFGGAKGGEIIELSDRIIQDVEHRFGMKLRLEVNIVL
ncbi:hypothetical protein HIM_05588 [Hirsutella minnesotensis 3608]|uniref:UDP-N-acetylmuramate dehydrogenase n=1 Tax=Hirsutella minnesotensis 3608 TaxID=1043627 RepID=A0A0F8A065_9HYPO|nr:hypothetical protein HIM_05588 [Hirsutella minnesotensis 3608]